MSYVQVLPEAPHGLIALIGVGSIVNTFFSGLTAWVVAGATSLIGMLGNAIAASTEPSLQQGFASEFAVIARIGALLTAPFLAVAVISAIVHQDLSILTRAFFIRLPLSLLFGGVAVEMVTLLLSATDGLSNAVLATASPSVQAILSSIGGSLTNSIAIGTGTSAGLGLFVGALLAGVTAVVAFFLWIELVIRGAAISVAVLFLPIALAGIVWPATAHWARRLGETIAALVLSKLVIAGVLALAATSIGDASGPSNVVEGIAALVLAVIAPFVLLRLIPAIEAGAAAQLEGLSRRGMSSGQQLAGLIGGLGAGDDFNARDLVGAVPEIPYVDSMDVPMSVIDDLAADIQRDVQRRRQTHDPSPGDVDSSTTSSELFEIPGGVQHE